MTLLSLSLNAQLLPNHMSGTTQYDALTSSPTRTMANKGLSRAPLRLNEGEYTMGPFEGDNLWDGGLGYVAYPNPQWILASTVLNREEFIGHEGDTIVGFRFALAGNATQTVRLTDFASIFMSQNGYLDIDDSYFWPIGMIGNTGGGNVETITTYSYDNDIVITAGSGDVNFYSITVYDSENHVLTRWNRDTTTTTVTIGSTNYGQYNIPSGWSVSSGSYFLRWNDTNNYGYLGYLRGGGSITISKDLLGSTSSVRVVINASTDDTSYGISVDNDPKTLTETLDDYTWTIEPTPHYTSVVTVGNGSTYSSNLPVYGYEQDYGYTTQMIYSAAQLGLESGTEITSLTFYPREGFGINFWGSTVTLKLGNTTVSNYGTGTSGTAITGLTTVASKQITATDPNCTAWTFTFDQPFIYNGNNIVVEVSCPGYRYDGTYSGQWATSYFMGDNQSSNVSLQDEDNGPSSFLPKASFGFNGSGGSGGEYVDLAGGQWYDYYLDEPVLFTVPGDTINRLLIGYQYLQHPASATDQNRYPLAVNDESTTHNHIFNMYLQTSEGTSTTTSDETTVANGTATSQFLPAYGYYADYGFQDQMIYTAATLGLQAGDMINSITFYPTSGTYYSTTYNGINFAGNITLKLANTTASNFGTSSSSSASKITSGLTTVATVSVSKNTSQTEWTITFSTPFEYTGENLLVDVSAPSGGSYGRSFFLGENQSSYVSVYSNAASSSSSIPTTGTNNQFLPKAKFGYDRTTTTDPTYQLGWWGMNLSNYGDLAVQLILKPGKEKTPTPVITYTFDNGYYYVTATATGDNADNATVTLTVNGTTATGTHSVTIPLGRLNGQGNDYTVTATATAVEPDKAVSDPANATITVEGTVLDPTPTPTIVTNLLDLTMEVTGSGQGEVHMYIDGQEVDCHTYLERTDEEYTVQVTVTAQITDGEHSMATTTQTVVVPPLTDLDLTGWTLLPGLYNNDEVITWDNHLMFIDRFTVSTANNDHPIQYKYVMTENNTKLEPPLRSTNELFIPVQRTNSRVLGYHTEEEVELDRDRNHVELNLMNAQVEMYLENNNDIYYYTLDRSKNNRNNDEYYLPLSELQNAGNNYVEMNDYYTLYEPFEFGKAMRYDTINTALPATAAQGDNGKHVGIYNESFMNYVPIVWTFGNKPSNKRANWDVDHKHNSYGSPIWQTSVGQVELVGKPKLERQTGYHGSANWNEDSILIRVDTIQLDPENNPDSIRLDSIWHYTPCSLYMITDLHALGYLPSFDFTNIWYEPYLFRVWVESKEGNLRNYQRVPGIPTDPEHTGEHYVGTGKIPANTPYLVWEEYLDDPEASDNIGIQGNVVTFNKTKIEQVDTTNGHWTAPESWNMIFAGINDLTADDLVIYVRFYYRSTGEALNAIHNNVMYMLGNRTSEPPREYYGVEDEGDPDPDIPTCIKGVFDTGKSLADIVSVTYYNLQGAQSTKPFDGINIVVTRYSDGTMTSKKVVRVR